MGELLLCQQLRECLDAAFLGMFYNGEKVVRADQKPSRPAVLH